MKDQYGFISVLTFAEDGISIEFPDLPGCLSCAETQEEAVTNASEVLGLYLVGMEEDGETIPEPTPITGIHLEENQVPLFVSVNMHLERQKVKPVFVRKTLMIPSDLNEQARLANINLSQLFQKALRQELRGMR